MNYIQLNEDNLAQEHICCAISEKKGEHRSADKKAWLQDRLKEGLVFLKADVRGKAFIEYIDSAYAWTPIQADNMLVINCLWVSGQYKGQGISNDLMKHCMQDAKRQNKNGICILSGKKKLPFLADPKYLTYKGFQLADEVDAYRLYYLPLQQDVKPPRFFDHAKSLRCEEDGLVLYYYGQCPHAIQYAEIAGKLAEASGIPTHLHHLKTREEARLVPCPTNSYALFLDHRFITNEILSEKKLERLFHDYTA